MPGRDLGYSGVTVWNPAGKLRLGDAGTIRRSVHEVADLDPRAEAIPEDGHIGELPSEASGVMTDTRLMPSSLAREPQDLEVILPAIGTRRWRRSPRAPIPLPQSPGGKELRTAELLDTILARPLFNSSRRPDAGAVAAAGDTDLADKRLTGILIRPGRHVAIFAIKDARP